jgi:cell division protein FtsB
LEEKLNSQIKKLTAHVGSLAAEQMMIFSEVKSDVEENNAKAAR